MTKHFSRWAAKQKIPKHEPANALTEIVAGNFKANLGGSLYKNCFQRIIKNFAEAIA